MRIPYVGTPSVGMPLVGIPSVGMPLVGIPFVDIPVKCIGSSEPTQHLPSSARLQSNLEKYPAHPLHIIQSRQKTNLNEENSKYAFNFPLISHILFIFFHAKNP